MRFRNGPMAVAKNSEGRAYPRPPPPRSRAWGGRVPSRAAPRGSHRRAPPARPAAPSAVPSVGPAPARPSGTSPLVPLRLGTADGRRGDGAGWWPSTSTPAGRITRQRGRYRCDRHHPRIEPVPRLAADTGDLAAGERCLRHAGEERRPTPGGRRGHRSEAGGSGSGRLAGGGRVSRPWPSPTPPPVPSGRRGRGHLGGGSDGLHRQLDGACDRALRANSEATGGRAPGARHAGRRQVPPGSGPGRECRACGHAAPIPPTNSGPAREAVTLPPVGVSGGRDRRLVAARAWTREGERAAMSRQDDRGRTGRGPETPAAF